MANPEHLEILKQGVQAWNAWREVHPEVMPDLSGADLSYANLPYADLSGADLTHVSLTPSNLYSATLARADLSYANLSGAFVIKANLSSANLSYANLSGAKLTHTSLILSTLYYANLTDTDLSYTHCSNVNISHADLSRAKLSYADLSRANLSCADLTDASMEATNLSNAFLEDVDLENADLTQAVLVGTDVTGATFTGCKVHGISVWNLKGEPKGQNNLLITKTIEPAITVDNLEVAQFIYMLINYKKLRDVIQTITSKVVLILGRFTEERLVVLKALQDELRQYTDDDGKAKYIPVMFDFEPDKASKDLLETVQAIADMSRFIVADISAAKGVPLELGAVAPRLEVPIKLIFDLSTGEEPVSMVESLLKYDWFMDEVCGYRSAKQLCAAVEEEIITPVERMVDALQTKKKMRGFKIKEAGG